VRIGDLARRAGVSAKAVRYYEQLGLVVPTRSANGYRSYDEKHLRVVSEIKQLAADGITPGRAAPFVECLSAGHEHSDECPASLAAYRDSITELDRTITSLTTRRASLVRRLEESATRGFGMEAYKVTTDYTELPDNLPVPGDDGAAAHLLDVAMPTVTLPATDGTAVDLAGLGPDRAIIYMYPLTGRPGVDLPEGWDAIPGARGCSTEACDFRDHFADLRRAGAARVYGLSSQDTDYQVEVVRRLNLPFAMLSDETFALADALDLPTFSAPGQDRLYSRLTLVVRHNRIEHVFYPIFPPNTHAQQVLAWLADHPTP
jgi:peroxiredoxin/DNA-binding transcriptional MerR regulator